MFIITIKYLKRSILLAVSSFSFSTAIAAEKPEFNKPRFDAEVESLHLQNTTVRDYYNRMNNIVVLRKKVSKYIQHNQIFDKYLAELYGNIVGNTMLRLLIANIRAKKSTGFWIEAGAEDTFDGAQITINFDDYNETGMTKKPLCAFDCREVDPKKRLVPKYDSIGDTIFHELCHALHTCNESAQTECKLLERIYGSQQEKYLWTYDKSKRPDKYEDDEELYNITGYFDGGFDPINCNMYDIYKCLKNKEPIIQRVFHAGYASVRQKIDNNEITNSPYGISEFLINLDDYIVQKCSEPTQVTEPSERFALPPLSPSKPPGQAVKQNKPTPATMPSPLRPPKQAVKPNKITSVATTISPLSSSRPPIIRPVLPKK
jgi:hypothetical protein